MAHRMLLVLLTVVEAWAAPQVDPDRIYTPDTLWEILGSRQPEDTEGCRLSSEADSDMLRDTVDLRTNSVCQPLAGQVLWPPTGQCHELLTQGPCPPGQWLKLSSRDHVPVCAPRPCQSPDDDHVSFRGSCLNVKDDSSASTCPPTQQLIVNEFGEGECDCSPGMVFYQRNNMCYTPYTQGPCLPGYIIKVVDAGISGQANCVRNPCEEPRMVAINSDCHVQGEPGPHTNCYPLDSAGPCADGQLTIDNTLSEPLCIVTHSIFSIPSRRICARGSIRDSRGRCRKDFSQFLRAAPVTKRPTIVNGKFCEEGFVFLAGTCLKLTG